MRLLRNRLKRAAVIGLAWTAQLPVPAAATGMPMSDESATSATAMPASSGLGSPVTTDSPPCMGCYLAPPPALCMVGRRRSIRLRQEKFGSHCFSLQSVLRKERAPCQKSPYARERSWRA